MNPHHSDPGMFEMNDKFKCRAGFFCDGNSPVSTPKGGAKCKLGHFCPEGTVEEIPCPRGKLGKKLGLTGNNKCEPCDEGNGSEKRLNLFVLEISCQFRTNIDLSLV